MNYYDRLVDLLLEQRLIEATMSGATRATIKHLRGLRSIQKGRSKTHAPHEPPPLDPKSPLSKGITKAYTGVLRALPAIPLSKKREGGEPPSTTFSPGTGMATTKSDRVRAVMQRASRYTTRPRGRSSK